MGGGNKERAQSNYNAALTTAQQQSPYEQRRAQNNQKIEDWIDGGDYTQPPNEVKAFFNFADPAEQKKQMDVLANTRGQGAWAA